MSIKEVHDDGSQRGIKPETIRTRPFLVSTMSTGDRKRAFENAQFYSECCLHGIDKPEADNAAQSAREQYEKWWVSTKSSPATLATTSDSSRTKRRKLQDAASIRFNAAVDKETDQAISTTNGSTPRMAIVSSGEEDARQNMPIGRQSKEQQSLIHQIELSHISQSMRVIDAKREVVHIMEETGGDTSSRRFLELVDLLSSHYTAVGWDVRWRQGQKETLLDGKWRTLSKPTFNECLGRSESGKYQYTLGRIAFDMLRPTNIVCTIEDMYNTIQPLGLVDAQPPLFFPRSLKKEAQEEVRQSKLRNYDIEVALTIHGNQTRNGSPADTDKKDEFYLLHPIKCLITNHGFCVPDPATPNRISVWFTGGSIVPVDGTDAFAQWKELFDQSLAPRRDMAEFARVLAARILIGAQVPEGMSENGSMRYSFRRPIGGHGHVYCDVLYADDQFRILKGHHGSIFIFAKLPTFS